MAEISIFQTSGRTTIATTIAALGTATNGMTALIRGGVSPYTFMRLVYDSTYGQWVGDPLPVLAAGNFNTNWVSSVASGAGYFGINSTNVPGQTILPYKALADAGLTLQVRIFGEIKNSANDGTNYLACGYAHFNIGDTSPQVGLASQMTPYSGGPTAALHTLQDTGYQSPSGTAKDMIMLGPMIQRVGGTGTAASAFAQLIARWIA